MTRDLVMDGVFPWLAKVPTTAPWHLAPRLGPERGAARQRLIDWLAGMFARVFPGTGAGQCMEWAQAHVRMLGWEMMDAMAFSRLARPGGPQVVVRGLEHAQALAQRQQGFILVLNHFDRLLTAPVALAAHGISTHVLTMPVLENPDLADVQRRFLMRKIQGYTQVTRGMWQTTTQSIRSVHESLRKGGAWVILADAWRPEFGRLRSHAFLGGEIQLPTGIERLAHSTGVPLLHGRTHSEGPDRLVVTIEPLPSDPVMAINGVIQQLERDVRERPWAWWHWGLWDQMWKPVVEGTPV